MADNISSAQQTSSTGSNSGTLFRDVNASASLGEFLNNFNASTSAADSGHITVGDKIIGAEKRARSEFSLLKILAIAGIGFLAFKIYKQNGGK